MAADAPMYVAILGGQSNMSGRGGVVTSPIGSRVWDRYVPPEAEPPAGSVLRWTADNAWEEAAEPLHWDIDVGKACGVGPGLVFATRLVREGAAARVGLVPCAVGGTEMDRWMPDADLYEHMVRRTEDALRAAPGNATLRMLLWYQGESDADTEEHADALPAKFGAMVAALRARLGVPELPVLQVAITCRNTTVAPLAERVRAGQLGARLPALRTVDAESLELAADGLHLTTAAQVSLGTQLADAACALEAERAAGGPAAHA